MRAFRTALSPLLPPTMICIARVVFALGLVIWIQAVGADGVVPYIWLSGVGIVFALDGIDGYVARRIGVACELGSAIDVAADRIVEAMFFGVLAANRLLPMWVVAAYAIRIIVVDITRLLAWRAGGASQAHAALVGWEYIVTESRLWKGLYGGAKMLLVMASGLRLPIEVIAWSVVVISALRGYVFVQGFVRQLGVTSANAAYVQCRERRGLILSLTVDCATVIGWWVSCVRMP